ncbi:MAG: hypothetical protein JO165_04180 [Candidatus Eremiobacteraeota bacterium]|nr:hypothetical protein [Candidatus Eremiobacteraeota bacterium]
MKVLAAAALSLALVLLGASRASAQNVPCVGCAISATQNAIQSQINQQIVNQSVQNAINSQLQTQTVNQQLQSQQMRIRLQNDLLQNSNAIQLILLEQEMQLLQLNLVPANVAVPKVKSAKPQPH